MCRIVIGRIGVEGVLMLGCIMFLLFLVMGIWMILGSVGLVLECLTRILSMLTI